jgi:multisubunit Na+/H+ antiporter MnhG subunit
MLNAFLTLPYTKHLMHHAKTAAHLPPIMLYAFLTLPYAKHLMHHAKSAATFLP